jgi:CubicO group peptidase (beta-lactamase class C family)
LKKKSSSILLVLAFVLTSCGRGIPTATPSPIDPEIQQRIQRIENGLRPMTVEGQVDWEETRALAERMQQYGVPGVSIAVINDFQIEWARGYGILEAGGDDPVTLDVLFHAGSVAKPVSAAAALALVDSDLLDLDEDVNEQLVSWQIPDNEFTDEEKVTLRRLLSHSAGLRDGFTDRSSSDRMPDYFAPAGEAPTVALQQLLDANAGVDVDGPTYVASVPGATFRYANADYAIAELLIVDVVQQPFAEFMSETILEPLRMFSSTFEQPLPTELRSRATVEHDTSGQPLEGDRLHFPLLAAGGLWTTPSDLAVFAIEIMRAYHGQSDRIIPQELAIEMLSPQIETPNDLIGDSFGLGFQLIGEGQDLAIMHTGGTWGSTCLIWLYPETGQGVVIMTNSASAQGIIRFEILLGIAVEYGWTINP